MNRHLSAVWRFLNDQNRRLVSGLERLDRQLDPFFLEGYGLRKSDLLNLYVELELVADLFDQRVGVDLADLEAVESELLARFPTCTGSDWLAVR